MPQILAYFEAFADVFALWPLVRLNTVVTWLEPLGATSQDSSSSATQVAGDHFSNGAAALRGGSRGTGSDSSNTAHAGSGEGACGSVQTNSSGNAVSAEGGVASSAWRVHTAPAHGTTFGAHGQQAVGAGTASSAAVEHFDAVVSCVGNYRCHPAGPEGCLLAAKQPVPV